MENLFLQTMPRQATPHYSVAQDVDQWRFSELESIEAKFFSTLVRRDVSGFYPGTEENYGERFCADRSFISIDGKLRRRRSVWAVYIDNRPVAFCGLTRKLGSTGKIGPLVTRPEFRNLGLGRLLIHELEKKCIVDDVRKLFMTAPVVNETVLSFALAVGFEIEGLLREHYTSSHDELVLAKRLTARRGKVLSPSNSLHVAFGKIGARTISPSSLTHEPALQQAFGHRTVHGQSLRLYPKRGGAVKIEAKHWSQEVISELPKIERALRDEGVRRLYAMITEQMPEHAYILDRLGFEVEASFCSAYGDRSGIDLFAKGLRI